MSIPDESDDDVSRGYALFNEGDLDGAEEAYRRADDAGSAEGALLLGVVLRKRGDVVGAEAAYRRCEDRGDPRGSCNLAALLQDCGDMDGAEDAYRRADAAGFVGGSYGLGQVLYARGDIAGAIVATRRADELGDPEGSYNLGVLLEKTNDIVGAEAAFRRSDERGDGSGAAALGRLLQERGEVVEAEAAYRRSDERADPNGSFALGSLLFQKGDVQGAISAFRRAADRGHPGAPEILATLASVTEGETPGHDGLPLSEMSTLAAASPNIAFAQKDAAALIHTVYEALRESAEQISIKEPDLSQAVSHSKAVANQLTEAFYALYGSPLGRRANVPSRFHSLAEWESNAQELVRDIQNSRLPLTSNRRREQQARHATAATELAATLDYVQRSELIGSFDIFRRDLPQLLGETIQNQSDKVEGAYSSLHRIPPIIGDLAPEAFEPGPVPGAGNLTVQVGTAVLGPLQVSLRPPSKDGVAVPEVTVAVPTWPLAVPLLLNLDRDHGLLTDSRDAALGLILRLLSLLPAGQLKFDIYDPKRLGESASALLELGEASAAIIGDKVKSTERELNELLQRLEEHITVITQKYLQGTYDSLTEYNHAAGEVSEPYRLLVLYDYPAGFVSPDGEVLGSTLQQLKKVVEAGPRCGVFTIAVLSDLDVPRDPAARAKTIDPIVQLQILGVGKETTGQLNRLAAGGALTESETFLFQPTSKFVREARAAWNYEPPPPVQPSVLHAVLNQVQRGFVTAREIRVSPGQVATLARENAKRAVAVGLSAEQILPHPDEPETWWRDSSAERLVANFGRVGATEVASLRFDSQTNSSALIAGRPGAGKSVLLHALITSLCIRYPPSELELYLVDFKEGVEFKAYATGRLPHARVIAIESDREFGLSVLEGLDAELTRRGELFRSGMGEELNLPDYRARTGNELPRAVLVMDEFHVLFERDDKVSGRGAELLDRIIRQGRAFGIHSILASQTLAGLVGLGKHTISQIPIRLALQCSEADSRLILGDDNPDAQLLARTGEGIFNASNGLRDANRRFQAAFVASEERANLVTKMAGHGTPVRGLAVFEGHRPVEVSEAPLEAFKLSDAPATVSVPFGLPLSLAGPVCASFHREPANNLLMVLDDEPAYALLTSVIVAAGNQGARIELCDFGALDAPWTPTIEQLTGLGILNAVRGRQAPDVVTNIAKLVASRLDLQEYRSKSLLLLLSAIHRARDLDPDDADLGVGMAADLLSILRDGPEVGVHVVAWCEHVSSLQRRLSREAIREFGLRVAGSMSRGDSEHLVGSEVAAGLDPSQAVFDDQDRARTVRFRRFRQPDPTWVMKTLGHDEALQ